MPASKQAAMMSRRLQPTYDETPLTSPPSYQDTQLMSMLETKQKTVLKSFCAFSALCFCSLKLNIFGLKFSFPLVFLFILSNSCIGAVLSYC